MGSYTPNYNLYMPSIGEQGWGNLVSNNFEILDTISNTFNTQISNINENLTILNLATASGTRILTIPYPDNSVPTVTISTNNSAYNSNTKSYISISSYNTPINIQSISNYNSKCMIIIYSCGNITLSGNIDTYPTNLREETPPDDYNTNQYTTTINFNRNYTAYNPITLTYTANQNNSQLTMQYSDYINFVNKTIPTSTQTEYVGQYTLSIPYAYATGGRAGNNGTAGTAYNTCNGGGGGVVYVYNTSYTYEQEGGTGCIFGQYAGGDGQSDGYGYGSHASDKYRCALVIIANGNITINGSITQVGGNGNADSGDYTDSGGYGGGAVFAMSGYSGAGGGGGAPVFIYYTGSYTNNGTINTAGGNGNKSNNKFTVGTGGAGGIKTTKITL